jgi:hypothetical protein
VRVTRTEKDRVLAKLQGTVLYENPGNIAGLYKLALVGSPLALFAYAFRQALKEPGTPYELWFIGALAVLIAVYRTVNYFRDRSVKDIA